MANGARRLLAITHRPDPSYVHAPGTIIELRCEAVGAPAPSIHWFKNDAPVYEVNFQVKFCLGALLNKLI